MDEKPTCRPLTIKRPLRYHRRCAVGSVADVRRADDALLRTRCTGGERCRQAKRAEIIFRGSISEIRDSEIIFRVDRVWKGNVPAVVAVPNIERRESPCWPGFYRDHVKVGVELLVYARRIPWLNVNGYVPEAGSRTALVRDAAEDLRKLGRGRPPAERK